MPDDHELLIALRARSPEAFRQLFEVYSDRMYRLAAGMLGNEDEAEDVVQDVFCFIPLLTGLVGWCPLYLPFRFSTRKS